MTKTQHNLTRLKRRLQGAGITQARVAARAGVGVPHVCAVLAGRYKSRRVIKVALALLADKELLA